MLLFHAGSARRGRLQDNGHARIHDLRDHGRDLIPFLENLHEGVVENEQLARLCAGIFLVKTL